MNTTRIMTVVVLIVASGLALSQQARTKRTDLQRHDLSASEREVFQVRERDERDERQTTSGPLHSKESQTP